MKTLRGDFHWIEDDLIRISLRRRWIVGPDRGPFRKGDQVRILDISDEDKSSIDGVIEMIDSTKILAVVRVDRSTFRRVTGNEDSAT